MSRQISSTKNPVVLSRFTERALTDGMTIDNAVHASGEILSRGTLMAPQASNGKYRAYAEGTVTAAFSTGAATFTLDPTGAIAKNFRVADVIESTTGTALGTILTYNPTTGVGTLAANSSNALGTTNKVRIALSALPLAYPNAKVLTDEITMADSDDDRVGYFEGFFRQSATTITAAALAANGGVTITTDEVRFR